jgi:hypothetical protein
MVRLSIRDDSRGIENRNFVCGHQEAYVCHDLDLHFWRFVVPGMLNRAELIYPLLYRNAVVAIPQDGGDGKSVVSVRIRCQFVRCPALCAHDWAMGTGHPEFHPNLASYPRLPIRRGGDLLHPEELTEKQVEHLGRSRAFLALLLLPLLLDLLLGSAQSIFA